VNALIAPMTLPELEQSIKTLENSLDVIEIWLAASTFLVVIGLFLEYWHEVRELIEKIRRRPPFPWKAFQGIIGGVLVTVGVAGELAMQFGASTIETDIRAKSHQVEAQLNQKASQASKDAETAKVTAKSFERQIAASQVRIAEANRAASEAQQSAATEQLERVKLEVQLEATKRFSYIATLTFNGMVYTGGDVTMPTLISQAVEGTWFEPAINHFRPVCEAAALQKDRNAIGQFPDFPFTYYALSYCLQKQANPEWRTFAKKAVAIFEQTTTIGGHQKSHDDMLGYLRQLLAQP
jgi:hypothetical protein